MTTRRDFLLSGPALGVAITSPAIAAAPPAAPTVPTRASPSLRARNPVVNELGYRPNSAKHLMVPASDGRDQARLWRTDDGRAHEVASFPLKKVGGDFGSFLIADFSKITTPGRYRIALQFKLFTADPAAQNDWERGIVDMWSRDVVINDKVYDPALRAMVNYYRVQSCGASAHGYNHPCHTGPIARDDGGPTRPITGGWHSAHDHVRDLPEILHGIFGLLTLAEARPDLADEEDLAREIRWGNDYFLSIQLPDGTMPFGVYTRDYFGLKDAWDTSEYVLKTRPAPRYCQHLFTAAQAMCSRFFGTRDPDYARRCLAAGTRCAATWASAATNPKAWTAYDLGTAAFGAAELSRAATKGRYVSLASTLADTLVQQQTARGDWREVAGQETDPAPGYDLLNARALYPSYAPYGLAAVLRALPNDKGASRWRAALNRWVGMIDAFDAANGFAIAPQSPYLAQTAPRSREWNGTRFRYFLDSASTRLLVPGSRSIPWQAGHNGIVGGNGVTLALIAQIMSDRHAGGLAQRHWDWLLGLNPVEVTHIYGFGHNNPPPYPPADFVPPVPDIIGAGMQGFVGGDDDLPTAVGGYYGSSEFWMPQHSWMLALGAMVSTV